MPTVKQSDNPNNSLTVAGLDSDEFVPIVTIKVDNVKDATKNIFLIDSDEVTDVKDKSNKNQKTTLSEHIESDKRSFTTQQITTSKDEITLTFDIEKGNKESDDDKGILTVSLFKKLEDGTTTTEIEGVNITNETEFETTCGSTHSVKLEFKDLKESTDFYIDFFAKDDNNDVVIYDPFDGFFGTTGIFIDDNRGKLKNVHCGRFKVLYVVLGPEVFSEKEVDKYRKYIISTASRSKDHVRFPNTGGYGYGETDKHDCVTAVNRSLRKLLSDNSISAKANMDDQMLKLISIDYATEQIEIEFKDSKGKKTKGGTDPFDFLNKNLAEVLKENLSEDSGYYYFGMSIMDGFHSVMIVVKKSNVLQFQIFDQHGSTIANDSLAGVNSWFGYSEINEWLLKYVKYGHPLDKGGKGITTTNIYQIKHKDEK